MPIDQSDLLRQASEFLESGDMDAIRIHEFELDGDEHDDDAIQRLHIDFKNDFDTAANGTEPTIRPSSQIRDRR